MERSADIEILPIQRVGGGYKDGEMKENFSSATAIRQAIESGNDFSDNLPEFVKAELPSILENKLDTLEKYAILSREAEKIAKVCDCTEGLENALKKAAQKNATLAETLTSARYTSSRIRRIALQNLLEIDESLIRESLCSPLYLRVLAVNKERSDVLSALAESSLPILARAHDENALTGTAKAVYETDLLRKKYTDCCTKQKRKRIFSYNMNDTREKFYFPIKNF